MNKIDNILDFANMVKNSPFKASMDDVACNPLTNNINLDHIDEDLYILLSYNGHLQYSTNVYRPEIDVMLYYNSSTEELENTLDINPFEIVGGVTLSMNSISQIKEIYSMLKAYNRPMNNQMEFVIETELDNQQTSLIVYPDKKNIKLVDFTFDYSRVEELDIAPELLLLVLDELKPLTMINLNLNEIKEPSLV